MSKSTEVRRTGLLLALFILVLAANLYPCTCVSRGNACPSLPVSENEAVFVGTVTKTAGKSIESLLRERRRLNPEVQISKTDWAAMVQEYKDSILDAWGDYLSDTQIKAIKEPVSNDTSLSIPELYKSRRIWVRVTEKFFGRIGETVELVTGFGGGDCGVPFETGKSFLIFAQGGSGSKFWATSICNGTEEVFPDDQGVRTLRDLKDDRSPAPRIYGNAFFLRVSARENPKVENAADQVIRLSREGHYLEQTKTDHHGRFLFDALIPGIYKVEFLGSQDSDGYKEVTLTGAGCARVGLWKTYH